MLFSLLPMALFKCTLFFCAIIGLYCLWWHTDICISWAGCWWAEVQVHWGGLMNRLADSGFSAGESCAVNSLDGNHIPCREEQKPWRNLPSNHQFTARFSYSILQHIQWIDFWWRTKLLLLLYFDVCAFPVFRYFICNVMSSDAVQQAHIIGLFNAQTS